MDLETVKKVLGDRFSFTADDTKAAIDAAGLSESANVLDVGTGLGNMAIMLALHGHHVITGEPEGDDSVYAKQDWLTHAKQAAVDHLIRFEPFDAAKMPFENGRFDGIFFLGALHHIAARNRTAVMQECLRTRKSGAVVCLLEPNENLVKMIRQNDPDHPEAADPNEYAEGLFPASSQINGKLFNIFIYR